MLRAFEGLGFRVNALGLGLRGFRGFSGFWVKGLGFRAFRVQG